MIAKGVKQIDNFHIVNQDLWLGIFNLVMVLALC
jgi:hypothetical protein